MRRVALFGALIAPALLAPALLGAQVVELQGGGSSYFNGYGLNANLWGSGYDGWLGVGYQDAWRMGGFVRARAHRDTIRAGNDVLVLRFPTDIFGTGQNLVVQGATLQGTRGPLGFSTFAGASATGLGVPLFAARRADRAFGALTITDSVAPHTRLYATVIAAAHLTSAIAAEWTDPSRGILSATTGVGAGRPFGVVSASFARDIWEGRASWMRAAPGYRRVDLPVPVQMRLDGLAAELTVRPRQWLALLGSRQTYVSDSGAAADQSRATGTALVITTQFGEAHGAGGVYRSETPLERNASAYAAAGTPIGAHFAVDAYALATNLRGRARVTPVLMLHERVTGQLSLDQVLTRSGNQTSVSLGGSFVGALADVSVGYQIVHMPFNIDNPFVRTLAFGLRLGIGDLRTRIGTTVLPTGEVQYDATAATFLYLGAANGLQPTVVRSRFDQYVVRGIVQDEEGIPISGAAIQVGESVAFTDSKGSFFLRAGRRRSLPFTVLTDEFMVRGRFTVVSAPEIVTPESDARAKPVVVVLRREP